MNIFLYIVINNLPPSGFLQRRDISLNDRISQLFSFASNICLDTKFRSSSIQTTRFFSIFLMVPPYIRLDFCFRYFFKDQFESPLRQSACFQKVDLHPSFLPQNFNIRRSGIFQPAWQYSNKSRSLIPLAAKKRALLSAHHRVSSVLQLVLRSRFRIFFRPVHLLQSEKYHYALSYFFILIVCASLTGYRRRHSQ